MDDFVLESYFGLRLLLICTFPLAPFLTSELWENLRVHQMSDKFEVVKYFGDTSKILKEQLLLSPNELLVLLKKEHDISELNIFVIKINFVIIMMLDKWKNERNIKYPNKDFG